MCIHTICDDHDKITTYVHIYIYKYIYIYIRPSVGTVCLIVTSRASGDNLGYFWDFWTRDMSQTWGVFLDLDLNASGLRPRRIKP